MNNNKRNICGYMIADAPIAIWLIFVMLTFPFIDMAAISIRYTFMVSASRDAAHAAARTKSFMANVSGTDLSAVNTARNQAMATANAFSEITISDVTTRILITDLASRRVTSQTTPLAQPADTSANLYQIETVVSGQINPIINCDTGEVPGIPGLSAPVPISVASREVCEYPQGLNQ